MRKDSRCPNQKKEHMGDFPKQAKLCKWIILHRVDLERSYVHFNNMEITTQRFISTTNYIGGNHKKA
jgi:hypothetical protein